MSAKQGRTRVRKADKAPSLAALAAAVVLAGLLPVASVPLLTDPVMSLRLLVLGLGLAAGLMAPDRHRLSRRLVITLAAAAGTFVVAALVGQTPLLSLVGRYPRYEGLPMVAAYGLALAVGARVLSTAYPRRIFTAALSLAAAVNGVTAIGQAVFDSTERVTGVLGNSTTLGTFGLLALLVVGWSLATAPRPVLWVGTLGAAACVVLSASRGVLVGAAVALAVMLVLRRRQADAPRWQVLLGAGAVVVVASLLVPTTSARITGASPFAESTVSGRLLLWGESVRLWLAHPVTGVGPSRFVDEINRFHTPAWAAAVGPYAPPDSPHNVLLQVVCATGALGLLGLLAVGVMAARDALAVRSPLLVPAAAVAAGLVATYLTSFTDPVTTTLGAVVVGGALASVHDTPVRPAVRRATAIATTAVCLVLGTSLVVAEAQYSSLLTTRDPGQVARRTIAVRPWDPDLTRRVAYTAAKLATSSGDDVTYLVSPLSAACRQLPSSIECLLTLASVQDLGKHHAEALAAADAALEVDPTNVDAHLARGIALAGLTRYAEAEATFRRAVDLRPTAPEPWTDLASLYTIMGRTADATAAKATAASLTKR